MIVSHKYKFIFVKTTKVGGTSLEMYLSNICGENDIITPFWHPESQHKPKNFKGYFNPYFEIAYRSKISKSPKILFHNTISDIINQNKFFENIPAWQLKCRIPDKVWNNYYKFTIERNPWDKCVSRFFHSKGVYEPKYGKELTFEMWWSYFLNRIKQPWCTTSFGSEAPYNFPRYSDWQTGKLIVDKVCRYEFLDDELTNLFNMLGVPFNGLDRFKAKSGYRKDKRHYSAFFDDGNMKYVKKIADTFKEEIKFMEYKFEDKSF